MKKIFLPTNIDIEKIMLIANNKYINTVTKEFTQYSYDLKTLNIEACYYILFTIIKETMFRLNTLDNKAKYVKDESFIYNDIYITLPSKQLEGIDKNYNKIMSFLCNQHINYDNILYRSNYENRKAYSYSINYNYINNHFKIIDIYKRSILKRMNQDCVVKINNSVINKSLKRLKKDFTEKTLIDISEIDTKIYSTNVTAEYISLFNLFDLYNGKKWMSMNIDTDGRLHHNITNMKSIHRKYLRTANGELFSEIDISSCIPLLFIVSMFDTYKDHEVSNLNDELINYRKLFNLTYKSLTNYAIDLLTKEISIILDSILNSKFYELIINNSDFKKSDILSYFFRRNNSHLELENHIKSKFPNFHYFIYKMKDNENWVDHYGYQPYLDCNKLLAHYLFHLESDLMLYNVIPLIKNIEVLTIHDCVLVPYRYQEHVIKIIKTVFHTIIKVKPHIKVKSLNHNMFENKM